LADLDDGSIIVDEEWRQHTVGERVRVWRGDGSAATLRIVAVLREGTGSNGVYVTARNAPGATVDRVDIRLTPGTSTAAATSLLRPLVANAGAQLRTGSQWIAAQQPRTAAQTRAGFLVVLGIALLYTGIALANTSVMATADRTGELAALRLAGATRGQVLRLVAAEAGVVVSVGALLGLVVTGVNLAGLQGALTLLGAGSAGIVVPWRALAWVTTACAALAVTSALGPAALADRRR
jgi:putative ABC transport system permease protein